MEGSLRMATVVLPGRWVIEILLFVSFSSIQTYMLNPCRVQLLKHLQHLQGKGS